MIVVQLKGGLGNQLFQYAAGYSLASFHNVSLRLDIAELSGNATSADTKRDFELAKFNCNIDIASQMDVQSVMPTTASSVWAEKFKIPYKRKIFKESKFEFDTNFFKAGNNIYLKGYRQSEKYFAFVKQQIVAQFKIKDEFITNVQSISDEMLAVNSVAVHIRRKDYLTPHAAKVHGVLNASYYNEAAALVAQKINNPVFYIFSDDMDWVKDNFKFNKNTYFITSKESASAITDFYLISSCKHQVIANSTFSWWAAYLNISANKIVVAPQKWFNQANYNTKDLIPSGWYRI